MAIKTGNSMRVYVTDKASGGSYTWLAGEQNSSVNLSAEMLDVSDKYSEWKQYLPGMKGGTIDVTVFADDDASGPQHKLLSALAKGTQVYVFVGKLTGSTSQTPSEGDMAAAYVTSIGNTYDNNGVASRSISLQITGAVTHYPTITA